MIETRGSNSRGPAWETARGLANKHFANTQTTRPKNTMKLRF